MDIFVLILWIAPGDSAADDPGTSKIVGRVPLLEGTTSQNLLRDDEALWFIAGDHEAIMRQI